jgi:hypothetical protein
MEATMNVEEVNQFAIENELEWPNVQLPKDDLEKNRNAEVTHKIYDLTTDEIEIVLYFTDVETDEKKFLGIIDGALAFTFLEKAGIPFPATL